VSGVSQVVNGNVNVVEEDITGIIYIYCIHHCIHCGMNPRSGDSGKDDMRADVIVFGGGPSGLAVAQGCVNCGKSVIVVEAEPMLGGCHRVVRHPEGNIFTEHGPRVYINNFRTFKTLLADMGLAFDDFFVEAHGYGFENQGGMSPARMTWKELGALAFAVIRHVLLAGGQESTHKSMAEFMDDRSFSHRARWYIDTLCRLTDGGGASTYSVYQFMEVINMSVGKTLYKPRLPNDHPESFVSRWAAYLRGKGVRLVTGWALKEIVSTAGNNQAKVKKAVIVEAHYPSDNRNNRNNSHREVAVYAHEAYVLAMPPSVFAPILLASPSSSVRNAFGRAQEFLEWSKNTRYLDYFCFTLRWTEPHKVRKVKEYEADRKQEPRTPWGIGFMWMEFPEEHGLTYSCAVTRPDVPASRKNTNRTKRGKTLHECESEQEWLEEAVQQLIEATGLPDPDARVAFPDAVRNGDTWKNRTTGFFKAAGQPYLPQTSTTLPNLFNVGCQNGRQHYAITTIEAAVSNSVALVNTLCSPSTPSHVVHRYNIHAPVITLRRVIVWSYVAVLIIALACTAAIHAYA